MSIIGPRPDLPEDLNIYDDYQRIKIKIRPGITGYSQAYYRNSITQYEKFNLDSYYSENISIIMDIKIIIRTIFTVVKNQHVFKN